MPRPTARWVQMILFPIPPLPPPHYVGGSLGLTLREALKTYKGYAVLTNPEKP